MQNSSRDQGFELLNCNLSVSDINHFIHKNTTIVAECFEKNAEVA